MAKNENKVEQTASKPKGKKRKLNIEEDVPEGKIYLNPQRKASKRKSHVNSTTSKISKLTNPPDKNSPSDDEIREPTLKELRESEKPENVYDVETIRQKKKKSHEKNVKVKNDRALTKDSAKNEDYLKRWKDNRSEWKFEKLRQISIQNAILDAEKIGDEAFEIGLEYLAGTKGAARNVIEKLTETEINRLDEEFEKTPSSKEDSAKMSRYKRARELLQVLG